MSQVSKSKGQEAMSTAGLVNGDDPRAYFRKLVEKESRGYGDQERAVREVSRGCGLTFWSGYNLFIGKTKGTSEATVRSIRRFGLRMMEADLRVARRNYEEAKRLCDEMDDETLAAELSDLAGQIESLAARVKARKEALK